MTKTVKATEIVEGDVITIDGVEVTLTKVRRMPTSWIVRGGRPWIQFFGITADGYKCRGFEDDESVELVACEMMVREPYAPCGCSRHGVATTEDDIDN